MHLNDRQINRMAEAMLTALLDRGGAQLSSERSRALNCIEAVIRASQQQEAGLEVYRAQAPDVDPQKMLMMIKKKLAEEKGFPL